MGAMGKKSGVVLAAAVAAWSASVLPATAATWDGGDGTWSTSAGHWDGGANWVQGSDATFGGPAGSTVSLGEAINVGSITYGEFSDGLTIDLNGFDLSQAGGSSFFVDPGPTPPDTSVDPSLITITNTSGTTGTYTVTSPGTTWPRLSGNMNVTFNGTGTWIPGANNDFTGVLLVNNGGQLRTDNGNASLGSASGTIQLDGTNTLLNFSAAGLAETYTRDIQMLNSTVRLASNGVKVITVTGSISGGDLNVINNQGTIILAGANTYTGATNLTVATGSGAALVLANDQALGSSTSIVVGSGDQGTVGLMANPVSGNDITLGAGTNLNLQGSVPTSGLGMLHNFGGDNTFEGSIALASNTYRTISAEDGSSLTLTGVVGSNSSARGLMKFGDGTVVLTGANTYGQANISDGSNGTNIAQGTLRVDFSQSSVDAEIINNGPGPGGTFSLTSNRSSQLVLGGGTLEVVGGGAGDENVQSFANRNAHGFTINPGESSVNVVQNGADSVTVNLGRLMENSTSGTSGGGTNPGGRHVGGTVDFTLPTTGSITLASSAGAVGTTDTILTSNGAAFATVGGNDWAAVDSARHVVGGSTITGFYTANGAASLSGNADMSSGSDTTLGADAAVTSLRFHNSGTRAVNLGGNTLTTGGILVTADGNGPTSISGGTLRGAAATLVADRQDLVIIQRNTSDALTVDATIADNGTATALTKAGAGTLALDSANTYTGPTMLTGGVLKLGDAGALGGGNLVLKGGVVGLTADSGDFTRALGAGAGQVRWYTAEGINSIGTSAQTSPITGGSGGFAAYGGTRAVNIGGSGATLRWGGYSGSPNGSDYFLRSLSNLVLGANDADGTVDFQNGISLYSGNTTTYQQRTIQVNDGSADIDARISGIISSNEAGLTKAGAGTLELSATNTYRGETIINGGTLIVSGSLDAASNISVNSGGTLGGNGGMGNVSVNSGGTVSPGASIDAMSLTSLSLAGGSSALFEIAGDGASGNFDTIIASGDVAFGGTLALDFSQDFGADQWDLFDFAGSSGNFASIVDVSGHYASGSLSFDPGTGILSTSVPEPASVAFIALGGLAMLGRRRRRA